MWTNHNPEATTQSAATALPPPTTICPPTCAQLTLCHDSLVVHCHSNTNARYTTDGDVQACAGLQPHVACPWYRDYSLHGGCNCARAIEVQQARTNPWTDVEKAIYADVFLQHPKNFHQVRRLF